MVPELRVRAVNDHRTANGRYVLYWMTAARRTRYNFALDHAIDRADALGLPLVVLEAVRVGYRWASDRHHRFAIDGMRDNRLRFTEAGVAWHGYVEPSPGAGRGLLAALAADAALVVTDDWPCFFLPNMLAAAARLPVRLEAVDGNGLLPLRAPAKELVRAHDFRRMLMKSLAPHLLHRPDPDPLTRISVASAEIRPEILERWPSNLDVDLASLPIDHQVPPVAEAGGESFANNLLRRFVADGLSRYPERNHPDVDGASTLSPWLHWGHVSTHGVFDAVARRDGWKPGDTKLGVSEDKHGWWGVSPEAAGFLDELVTWRELAFHTAVWNPRFDQYAGLPDWARASLEKHASDPRRVYDLDTLDAGRTGDRVWNAAQRELRTEGRVQNYLRMNWGKRVLEWSASPEEAFDRLVHLNNKWALDGRDPNSWAGISWVFGRYDRPWGPERPIFGTIRYMTSENTLKKLEMTKYMRRWG
jgi:deoxyribodipyrimidine photo-lyase